MIIEIIKVVIGSLVFALCATLWFRALINSEDDDFDGWEPCAAEIKKNFNIYFNVFKYERQGAK